MLNGQPGSEKVYFTKNIEKTKTMFRWGGWKYMVRVRHLLMKWNIWVNNEDAMPEIFKWIRLRWTSIGAILWRTTNSCCVLKWQFLISLYFQQWRLILRNMDNECENDTKSASWEAWKGMLGKTRQVNTSIN